MGEETQREKEKLLKTEITHYEQFLPFPLCFQKTCTANTKKPGLAWERVKHHEFHGPITMRCPACYNASQRCSQSMFPGLFLTSI